MESSRTSEPKNSRRLPLWVIILAFIVLVGFLALLAWGLNRSQQPSIQVGDPVPAFTLNTFEGEQINTADLKGKVILVNFWASWCTPCSTEADELQQAWRSYAGSEQVVFLGINWADTEPEARVYLDQYQVTYPNGPDLRTAVSQMFRTTGVPETYVIDRDGKLAYVKKGPFQSAAEIQAVVDSLLEK